LFDLAMCYGLKGEVDDAISSGEQSLQILAQIDNIAQRIVRENLDKWKNEFQRIWVWLRMPVVLSIREAQQKHAHYYEEALRQNHRLYNTGGSNPIIALQQFDFEWQNILIGQKWATDNASSDCHGSG
jgi:hypothetical protein